jgi:hypothetical protein
MLRRHAGLQHRVEVEVRGQPVSTAHETEPGQVTAHRVHGGEEVRLLGGGRQDQHADPGPPQQALHLGPPPVGRQRDEDEVRAVAGQVGQGQGHPVPGLDGHHRARLDLVLD